MTSVALHLFIADRDPQLWVPRVQPPAHGRRQHRLAAGQPTARQYRRRAIGE